MTPLVLFGGTFDPVHYGHLRVAADVRAALRIPEIRLTPSGDPPHRPPPGAAAPDRLAMLYLGVREFPGVTVDPIEIDRGGLSYTVVTLELLRRQAPTRPLAWVVGADAFLTLPTWYRWHDILAFAHLVVVQRPGVDFAQTLQAPDYATLAAVWRASETRDVAALTNATCGAIISVDAGAHAISATAIRRLLAQPSHAGELARLLPQAVLAYIESHDLYQHSSDAP